MTEEWRTITGFPEHQISNKGRIRRGDKILTPTPNVIAGKAKPGHLVINLCQNKTKTRRYIHHLVLEEFEGPRPPGRQALHRNDVNSDNRIENLYWGTPSDNMHDQVRNGLHACANRTHCRNCGNALEQYQGKRQCRNCVLRSKREYQRRYVQAKLMAK